MERVKLWELKIWRVHGRECIYRMERDKFDIWVWSCESWRFEEFMDVYIVWKETYSIYECGVVRVEDGKSRDNDVFLASDFSEWRETYLPSWFDISDSLWINIMKCVYESKLYEIFENLSLSLSLSLLSLSLSLSLCPARCPGGAWLSHAASRQA